MDMLFIILAIIVGYIVGSISWGLVIGKTFYHTDIREYGSGNLGGTNAGRVLGKKVGIAVIFLDTFKAFLVMWLFSFFSKAAIPYAGCAAMIGHCFPVFAGFRGGKGVASAMGYLLGLGVFGIQDFVFVFIYPVLIFILVLGFTKMVSLSSMVALFSAGIISLVTSSDKSISVMILLMAIFVIYRHKANIKRIINKTESKVKWIR